MKKPDFLIIPTIVADDPKIQPLDAQVYAYVYWLERLRDGRCVASNDTLADLCRTDSGSIKNSLGRLENAGYIRRIYKDEAKRNRVEIRTLVRYGVASGDDSTMHQVMTRVASGDAQKKKRERVKEKKYQPPTPSRGEAPKIVNHFFELKGWADKGKEFYTKNKIIYGRFIRPAGDILEVCEGNLEYAKDRVSKVAAWANSRELDWSLETVIKKFMDIDQLQEKEKKPYWKGNPMYKDHSGRWKVIMKDGRHLSYHSKLSEITYV